MIRLFFFFEKDSWLAWMPRAVWWADVLEHEWCLCFIFNPLLIHFLLFFYSITSCSFCFSVSSSCRACLLSIISYFNSVFLGVFWHPHLIYYPVFAFVLRNICCCLFVKVLGHTAGPHSVFGQWKWVVQCTKPILAPLGSSSNFLSDCTPLLTSLSSVLTHSFAL